MFRDLIYYNKNKVDQYKALITRKVDTEGAQDIFENQDKKISYLLECSAFEELLIDREDYYDYTSETPEIALKDIRLASIIKVSGEIYVPEQFDMVQLIDEFRPVIMKSITYKDQDEKEMMEIMFKNSKLRIPVYCELDESCDYWLGIGKIAPDNLLVDYNELDDYETQTVNIIARLESRKYYKDVPLPVFDIYKDFLGLNRVLRKQIQSGNKEEFEKISVEEDYLGLEFLAIYT